MADAQESSTAVAPKRGHRAKRNSRHELEELRQENKQLRETVAHLSELALNQIAGQLKPKSSRLVPKVDGGGANGWRIANAIKNVFARAESRVSDKLARLRS